MDINPRISALSVFMQQTLERVNATEQASQDGLLFLGNWHDAVPRMLVQDPALDPLAWGTWLVLKTHTVPNAPMAMPTYDRIAEQLKCSRTLLDKQLTTLRIARWLSSCTRVRGSGRFKGNVYALHDEPITLADALHLDPGYLTFLQDAQKHQNEDIRDLAERALSTVGHVIDKGMDITAPTSTLDRMAQRFAAANEIRPTEIDLTLFSTFGNRVHTIDSVTYAVRNRVQEMDSVTNTGDRVEKTDTVMPCNPVQNLESVTGSSSNIYNNYKYINTTTTKIPRENNDLVYPKSLTSDEQGIVRLYLQRLIPDLAHQHQDLLDELEGTLRSRRNGANPIINPVHYVMGLCKKAQQGEFNFTSHGLRVRKERVREQAQTEQAKKPVAKQTAQTVGAEQGVQMLKARMAQCAS